MKSILDCQTVSKLCNYGFISAEGQNKHHWREASLQH